VDVSEHLYLLKGEDNMLKILDAVASVFVISSLALVTGFVFHAFVLPVLFPTFYSALIEYLAVL